MRVGLPPFQVVLDDYRDDVYRFLVAAVGRDEADDSFQETFLAALRAYPRLKHGSNLKSWLFTIAHRKAMDGHRSRRRRPEPRNPLQELPEAAVEGPGEEFAIWEQVRRLPPKQQTAVLYRYAADLSYREIARILRSSEEAVRQNVSEGLKKLREVVES